MQRTAVFPLPFTAFARYTNNRCPSFSKGKPLPFFVIAALGNTTGADRLRVLAENVTAGINTWLWAQDHFITQLNPPGQAGQEWVVRDKVDYDGNLVLAPAAPAGPAAACCCLLRPLLPAVARCARYCPLCQLLPAVPAVPAVRIERKGLCLHGVFGGRCQQPVC